MGRRRSNPNTHPPIADAHDIGELTPAVRDVLADAFRHLDEGRPAAAVVVFKRLQHAHPDLFEADYGLSLALYRQGRWSRAEVSAARAIAISPQNPDGYAALGQAVAMQGRLGDAVAALIKALQLAPERVDLGLALCEAPAITNDLEAAADLLEELFGVEHAAGGAELLALVRLRQGRAEDAARLFEAVLAGGVDAYALRKLHAQALYQSDRFEEALGVYRRLASEQPDDGDLYGPLAGALSHLRRFGEALEVCDLGLRLDPAKEDLRRIKAQALLYLDRQMEIPLLFERMPDTLLSAGYFDLMRPLVEECRGIPGDVIECGVYKGGATIALAKVIAGTGKVIHACDTFEGMPRPTDHDNFHQQGDFSDTSLESVEQRWREAGVRDIIVPHRGLFQDTLPTMSDNRYCFAFLDADYYVSMLQALEHVYPRISPGGWIVVDDYGWIHCEGCKIAVDEFLADKPERAGFGCILSCLHGFRKQ